jgi:hypothetical protein
MKGGFMQIIKADIVKLWNQGHWVCVTTNGFVKRNGCAVMGRGNALAMAQVVPQLPELLGMHISRKGNHVGVIYDRIIAFPVKPSQGDYSMVLDRVRDLYRPGQIIPGFHCKASLELIKRSAEELVQLKKAGDIPIIYLPVPGVGNGELDFESVKPILEFLSSHGIVIVKK